MDVKKELLRTFSNAKLLAYLDDNSKFVHQACVYAYDILKNERGISFSEEENQRIARLLERKEKGEQPEIQEVADTPENAHYPKLHSKKYILSIGTGFTSLAAGYFILENLKDLGLNTKAYKRKVVASALFGFTVLLALLTLYYLYGYDLMLDYEKTHPYRYGRYKLTANNSFIYLYVITNGFFSYIIWNDFIPKEIKYRPKSDENR